MKVFKPGEKLRPYVRYYWVLESDEPFSILTFPIGCPQMIFHKRTPLRIPELGIKQSEFTLSGQVNFPSHIQSDGRLEMIVAVFYPHTIGMFIDTPPSAFYNMEISGYDIGCRELDGLAARMFDCEEQDECIWILENWLLARVNPSLNMRRVGCTLDAMFRSPDIEVGKLAETVCLSRKQYERVFRLCVGMNPKEYSRVVRFQKSMRLLQCGKRNFAGIAAECGYADQSHFIREFRQMSGHTPKSLLQHCAPYSDLFTNPIPI